MSGDKDLCGGDTVELGYNEQKAFQPPDPISRDFDSFGNREHSDVITGRINNNLEHSPYSYK